MSKTGTSLSTAFRKHPLHFDALYCIWSRPAKPAAILEATARPPWRSYQEKNMAIKNKIKSASDLSGGRARGCVRGACRDSDLVIPASRTCFKSFGADLPAPTLGS